MTKQTTDFTMSLPPLITYTEALLCSLAADSDKQMAIINNADNSENHNHHTVNDDKTTALLWVVQDKAEVLVLRKQLDNNNHHETDQSDLLTLAAITIQQRPQRYQLACFWLPTLTEELLQQYIPSIMRYRDLYAAHLLIAIDNSIDLRAYGLTVLDIADDINTESSTIALWQFNLYDYKKLPNWLNSDYWANPENWNKNRW